LGLSRVLHIPKRFGVFGICYRSFDAGLNIELKNPAQYYAALQVYEKDNNIRPTLELFPKEYRALKKNSRIMGDYTALKCGHLIFLCLVRASA
jgi:hypothetical protein